MQRSRSSTTSWQSCWQVAENRLEVAASKAPCCAVRQMLSSFHSVYTWPHMRCNGLMLTFEILHRPGQGMQRSRSSTTSWYSCWQEAENRLEVADSKAAWCAVRQMLSSLTVCIHGQVYDVMDRCSRLSFCRYQARACSAPDPRLPSWTAVGK